MALVHNLHYILVLYTYIMVNTILSITVREPWQHMLYEFCYAVSHVYATSGSLLSKSATLTLEYSTKKPATPSA